MNVPPVSIGPGERVLKVHEVTALPCTVLARTTVKDIVERAGAGWTVDMSGEAVSRSDEFGIVYRYRVTYVFEENGKNYRHDLINVLWSNDCNSISVASFPTLKLNLPRSSKGD